MGTMIKYEPVESLEALLAKPAPKPTLIDVPEWDCAVYVRGLTGTERDSWESSNTIRRPDGTIIGNPVGSRARLVIRGLCNAEGVRLISNDKEWAKLGDRDGAGLERLFDKIAEISGMTASSVEDAEGNSEPDQSGDSTSD